LSRTAGRLRKALPVNLEPVDDFPELPSHRANRLSGLDRMNELQEGRVTLQNLQRSFRYGESWRMTGGRTEHRLWNCTLHYHEWLYDLVAESSPDEALPLLRRILRDWIATCRPGQPGFTHFPWNGYVIGTRIEWWIRILLEGPELFWLECSDLRRQLIESLASQAAYLNGHVEWDLRANHLLRDARGLALAGRFLDDKVAHRWLENAARIAHEQVSEQVLPDGGHFERSPMYHIHAMEDLLVLALLLRDQSVVDELREAWSRMAEFLAWVRHPDGEIPLLNDGGIGAASPPEEMLRLGERIGAPVDVGQRAGARYFPDTGLVAWHGDPWTVFFDVGPLGPDYQPGHGHADTLTVDCSYGPYRLFVDAGTYDYDLGDRRRYDRSTAAHNTVCVDGEDSSEVWHIFRVGRRARTRRIEFDESGRGMTAGAAHDGYRHLSGRPVHVRRVELEGAGFSISDRIEGSGRHGVGGGFLLAPGWNAESVPGGWDLRQDVARVEVRVTGAPRLELGTRIRPYHPRYGVEVDATRLCWYIETELPTDVCISIR